MMKVQLTQLQSIKGAILPENQTYLSERTILSQVIGYQPFLVSLKNFK